MVFGYLEPNADTDDSETSTPISEDTVTANDIEQDDGNGEEETGTIAEAMVKGRLQSSPQGA